jgi:hypothetical protein
LSGFPPTKRKSVPGAAIQQVPQESGCDISFRVDLAGVRRDVLQHVQPGEVLIVSLLQVGDAFSVVCSTRRENRLVGALAAFAGLSRLIACLHQGVQYNAVVEEVSTTRCSVFVSRT